MNPQTNNAYAAPNCDVPDDLGDLLPSQGGPRPHMLGERALWAAVLSDALAVANGERQTCDYMSGVRSYEETWNRTQRQARSWIMERKGGYEFICGLIDIDPGWMRSQVMRPRLAGQKRRRHVRS